MIPKATIVAIANAAGLFPTTVDKDYVLGWLLYGVAAHAELSRWVFKGGTCLKKCFFDTYRFSEDLDFTVPAEVELSEAGIRGALSSLCAWVEGESGIRFPAGGLGVERYANKQGTESYQAKVTYDGAFPMPRSSLQRIKFDITQREILVGPVDQRTIFHPYADGPATAATMRCYSANEILAEKTRALYERQGRARDLYDVVHISRSFRDEVSPQIAREVLEKKFAFKKLEAPTVAAILARIEWDLVRRDWAEQLRHQLPKLPDIESFKADLLDALAWWMEPAQAAPLLPRTPTDVSQRAIARRPFSAPPTVRAGVMSFGGLPEAIRFAARNRMIATFSYHGTPRVVEPYSLRHPKTGNVLLYAFELTKAGASTGTIKAYVVDEIRAAEALEVRFVPQWMVEL
ncbi:MAG: nucleotidyl transferase AbiEii/AbiGii toxin family protein [Deltaproteobacteria bacterium]|nr:nucleotidyl transferase AbiEii/AbiGii toxin family protein [Nannocystaceae bacterium]